jgi:hypothetical protein
MAMELLYQANAADPQAFLKTKLVKQPPAEQLDHILQFIQSANKLDHTLPHLLQHAWQYLIDNRLWSPKYDTIDSLRADIDFDNTLLPFLNKATKLTQKAACATRIVHCNWRILPHDLFAAHSEFAPPIVTETLVAQLAKLSAISTPQHALPLLIRQAQSRRITPFAPKATDIIANDVTQVCNHISLHASKSSLSPVADSSPTP